MVGLGRALKCRAVGSNPARVTAVFNRWLWGFLQLRWKHHSPEPWKALFQPAWPTHTWTPQSLKSSGNEFPILVTCTLLGNIPLLLWAGHLITSFGVPSSCTTSRRFPFHLLCTTRVPVELRSYPHSGPAATSCPSGCHPEVGAGWCADGHSMGPLTFPMSSSPLPSPATARELST